MSLIIDQQVTNERKDTNELKNMNQKIYIKKRKLFKAGLNFDINYIFYGPPSILDSILKQLFRN